jgi:hypothetical protein
MLPFAGIGLALEKVFLIDPNTSELAAQFLACTVLFPIIGAAVVWLFYHLVLLLGYSQSVAIFSSVVLAFATMNFHYSVSTQEQTQVGLLLVVAILLMVKNLQRPSFLYAWLLCAVLGLCLLFRLASLVMVLPIYLLAAGAEVFSDRTTAKPKVASRWLAAGLLGTGGFVAIIAWYNYVRFGSVFESGYTLAKDDLEFNQNPNRCSIPDDYIWDWSQSHLLWRFDNIWGHLTNNRDFSSVEVIDEEPLIMKRNFSEESVRRAYCVNFFPFKARSILPSTKLFYPLLCVWLVLLAGFCAAVFQLVRFYIKQKT